MTLDELADELASRSRHITYTPAVTTPGQTGPKTAIQIANDILSGRGSAYIEPQHGLMVIRREPQECLPVSVVLVEDEDTGTCQYMRRYPDNHLGALDT